MASQVKQNGDIDQPLNISAPAPLISLRGFQWTTVDEKINLHPSQHADKPNTEVPEADEATAEDLDGPAQRTGEQQVLEKDPEDPKAADAKAAGAEAAGIEAVGAESTSRVHTRVAVVVDSAKPSTPDPPALPAPQLPFSTPGLPQQLPGQLGLVPGLPPNDPPDFPLKLFQGAYAGNGFNTIFRPRGLNDTTPFAIKPVIPNGAADDNILELNLTTEQLTFGGTIGAIPNRGLGLDNQADIFLKGLPYLQTIQDVTNPDTGKGDNPIPSGIHFETGMWLNVPASTSPPNQATVVRMASIPHGTTVNAQGVPLQGTGALQGFPGGPKFEVLDTTPFTISPPFTRLPQFFPSMKVANKNTARIPQNLDAFAAAQTITDDIIKNPNTVLQNAIAGQNIVETIVFQVSTGPPPPGGSPTPPSPLATSVNGGGTDNISFLVGKQDPVTITAPIPPVVAPNANAARMVSTFWIETVAYTVNVPILTTKATVLLKPQMANGIAPTPVFAITPPLTLPTKPTTITVPGLQVQYSQTVTLNFAGLSWPHVSVATLVPTDPQPFTMT